MKEGWETIKLGDACDVINGFAFKSHLFSEQGDDILRISNIQNGYVDLTDVAHFNKGDYPRVNFEKYAVLPNDIVVALSGATTGKFGINKTGKKLYLNQRVAICRESSPKVNHLFLLYYLQTQSKSFLETAEGVAQPNLSTEQMKQYIMPIPPLPEQERIVAELDCLSGVIEKQKQQLMELDNLAQAIFYDMFGDPITNEKGWKVKPLGDACGFQQGEQVPIEEQFEVCEEGMVRFLRIVDFTQGNEKPRYVMCKNTKHILQNEQVAIVRYGTPGFVCFGKSGLIANNLFKIIPKSEDIAFRFLVYWLYSDAFQSVIKDNQYGVALQAIKFSTIKDINLIIPPINLQQEFASKIEAIEKQKELIKQSLSETETLFNSRMDYYFN